MGAGVVSAMTLSHRGDSEKGTVISALEDAA